MIKNFSEMECQIDGLKARWQGDCTMNTVQAKESLFQFIKFIGQIEDGAKSVEESSSKEEVQKPPCKEPSKCQSSE